MKKVYNAYCKAEEFLFSFLFAVMVALVFSSAIARGIGKPQRNAELCNGFSLCSSHISTSCQSPKTRILYHISSGKSRAFRAKRGLHPEDNKCKRLEFKRFDKTQEYTVLIVVG